MNSPQPSLNQRQAALQQRMRLQRVLITGLMQPVMPTEHCPPRSLTMRYFNLHPGLATRLLTQGMTLLAGGRMLRTISLALLLGRAVRGLTTPRDNG